MNNDNIAWEPCAYFDGYRWRGGWRLTQEAADARDKEVLIKNGQGCRNK